MKNVLLVKGLVLAQLYFSQGSATWMDGICQERSKPGPEMPPDLLLGQRRERPPGFAHSAICFSAWWSIADKGQCLRGCEWGQTTQGWPCPQTLILKVLWDACWSGNSSTTVNFSISRTLLLGLLIVEIFICPENPCPQVGVTLRITLLYLWRWKAYSSWNMDLSVRWEQNRQLIHSKCYLSLVQGFLLQYAHVSVYPLRGRVQ